MEPLRKLVHFYADKIALEVERLKQRGYTEDEIAIVDNDGVMCAIPFTGPRSIPEQFKAAEGTTTTAQEAVTP